MLFVSLTGDQPSVRSCRQGRVLFVSLTGDQPTVRWQGRVLFVSLTGDQPSVRSCRQGRVLFVSLTGDQPSLRSCRQRRVLFVSLTGDLLSIGRDVCLLQTNYHCDSFLQEQVSQRKITCMQEENIVKIKNRKTATAEEEQRVLLRGVWSPSPVDKPDPITPSGLSPERRKYLYEKIREFCREDAKDLVCPNPDSPTHHPPETDLEQTPSKWPRR